MPPRRTTVSGLLLRACVLLALGAIINVAVAWACVIVHGTVDHEYTFYHNPRKEYPLVVSITSRIGYEVIWGVSNSGTALYHYRDQVRPYRRGIWWPAEPVRETAFYDAYAVGGGWPAIAMTAGKTTRYEVTEDKERIEVSPIIHWGVRWDRDAASPAATAIIPFRPYWPGFAINTLFYAAILWCPIVGYPACRRRIRRRRGQCPACAYPVGVSPVCTECGEPVVPMKVQRCD